MAYNRVDAGQCFSLVLLGSPSLYFSFNVARAFSISLKPLKISAGH